MGHGATVVRGSRTAQARPGPFGAWSRPSLLPGSMLSYAPVLAPQPAGAGLAAQTVLVLADELHVQVRVAVHHGCGLLGTRGRMSE